MQLWSALFTLVLVLDPLGNLPVCVSLMKSVPEGRRRRVLAREALVALVADIATSRGASALSKIHRRLARALVKQPRLLLCDEPTGNLDSASGARVLELIREQHALGTTVLLITHDARVAEQARHQLYLADGVLGAAQPA